MSNIRECDALVHVVRCFEDTDVRILKAMPFSLSNATFSTQIIHVDGSVNSQRDIAVINFELILSDLSQVERALERTLKTRGKVGIFSYN